MSAGRDERRDILAKRASNANVADRHFVSPAAMMSHHSAVAELLHRPLCAPRRCHSSRRCHAAVHAAAEPGSGAATVPPSWPGCVQQVRVRLCCLCACNAPRACPALTDVHAPAQLASCGFSADEADTMLRKAHGWGFQKYWRTTKDHEVPVESAVRAVAAVAPALMAHDRLVAPKQFRLPRPYALRSSDTLLATTQLASRLTYLRQLCDGDEDLLRTVLTAFPEAVALDVDTVLAPNVALLERTYRIPAGPALAGVLKRKPQVLGNNLDCSGDCAGECNRCWARF